MGQTTTEFELFCTTPDQTIRACMEKIDKNKKGVLIITDTLGKLLGSLSDGDIRRALLAGKNVTDNINGSFNLNPIKFAEADFKSGIAANAQIPSGISLIPIVAKDGKLVKLYIPSQHQNFSPISNYVVLMVGGEGQRLGELTKHTPKPLLHVGDKPILQTILDRLFLFGFRNIILCTRHLSEAFEEFCGDGSKFGLNISYFREDKKLGTIGAVKHLENKLHEPFLVMNGDLLTGLNYRNILDFHENCEGMMTIGCANFAVKIPYGVLEIEGISLKRVIEKPTYNYRVSGGIYVLDKELLEHIPLNTYFDITQLMDEIAKADQTINVFPIEEYWLDIGLPGDYLKANEDFDKIIKNN